jgi:hypothetical protein
MFRSGGTATVTMIVGGLLSAEPPRNQKIAAKIFSTHTSSNKATPETIFCQPSGGMAGVKFDFRASPLPRGRLHPWSDEMKFHVLDGPAELRLWAVPTTAT